MQNLDYSEWIDTITLVLTISGIMLGIIYTQILQSADDRPVLIKYLRAGYVRSLYQGGISRLLSGLDAFYGDKESSQAFNASLLLAYFYPFLFFVLGYGYLGGANQFSDVALLPADEYHRIWLFPALLLVLIIPFFVVLFALNNGDSFDEWCGGQLDRLNLSKNLLIHTCAMIVGVIAAVIFWTQNGGELWTTLVGFILGYLCIIVAFFVGNVGSSAFAIVGLALALGIFADLFSTVGAGFGAFVTAIAFAVIFFSAVIFADASAGAGILSIVITTFFFSVREDKNGISLMFAFFYLTLPLVNALLDWLSWWVSRWFLERTVQEPWVRVIVLDVMLDFGVAVLFMLALCLLLPAGAIFLDDLYAGWVDAKTGIAAQTGWQEYAVLARDDPWGKGIMVTLMLVTTLIPTLLHILMGLIAFFIHGLKGQALAGFLEQPRNNMRDIVASIWMFGYVVLAGMTGVALYQLFQHFAQLPIAQWLYNFTGYFFELP